MRVRTHMRWFAAVSAVALGAAGGSIALGAAPATAAPATISAVTPEVALLAGGEVVTVTGSGFDQWTWVEIDDVEVDTEIVSPTTLTFVAPAHAAGTATLRVIVSEIPSAPWSYEYVVAPPERVESPTPVPSAGEDGDQSVDPAPRPRRDVPDRSRPDDPDVREPDPGSRIPPELAATGPGSSAATLRLGFAVLLAGAFLVLVARRVGEPVRR